MIIQSGREMIKGFFDGAYPVKKKRHRLSLQDFENVVSFCKGEAPDNLLTVFQVAELLNVTASTVWCWVCAKKPGIPHFRVGSMVRFKREWLAEWAMAREEAIKKFNFEL